MPERAIKIGLHKIILPLSDEEEQRRFANLAEILSLVPAGQSSLNFLKDSDIPVHFGYVENMPEEIKGAYAMYTSYRKTRCILIVTDKSGSSWVTNTVIASRLVHEICHAFQADNGLIYDAESYYLKPHHHLIQTRFTEAAAHAWQGHCCFQLYQRAGDRSAWDYFQKDAPEIARAYKAAMDRYKTEKDALLAAFKAFFVSKPYLKFYDNHSLSHNEACLRSLSATFLRAARPVKLSQLEKCGLLMDGSGNYLTDTKDKKTIQKLVMKGPISSDNMVKMRALEARHGF